MARAARAVDDGDGLVARRRRLLAACGFRRRLGSAGCDRGSASRPATVAWRSAICAIGSPPSGLSLKMAKPAKATRNRPSTHGERLQSPVNGSRNRRFRAHRLLSERRAQIVGRLCHGSPRISRGRRYHGGARPVPRAGQSWRSQARWLLAQARTNGATKGGPRAALSRELSLVEPDQFAALLAGLSIAALSPVAGAVALTLMPCSRSAAIFRALSSLASGGT